MDSSIRNGRCYRDLKRLEKIREDAKTLQHLLKEKFTTNNRPKRCVPTDSRISPSVAAPSKSLRHATDQVRGKADKLSADSNRLQVPHSVLHKRSQRRNHKGD